LSQHFQIASEGKESETILGVSPLETEEAEPPKVEPDVKFFAPDSTESGDGEVSKFVDNDEGVKTENDEQYTVRNRPNSSENIHYVIERILSVLRVPSFYIVLRLGQAVFGTEERV
jgi:hypothetical protein